MIEVSWLGKCAEAADAVFCRKCGRKRDQANFFRAGREVELHRAVWVS